MQHPGILVVALVGGCAATNAPTKLNNEEAGGGRPSIACPTNAELASALGTEMLSLPPKEDQPWGEPAIETCVPLSISEPGWYVVGSVTRDSPLRYVTLHMAVAASSKKIVAFYADGEQPTRLMCDVKIDRVEATEVFLTQTCMDRMEQETKTSFAATIKAPKIELRPL